MAGFFKRQTKVMHALTVLVFVIVFLPSCSTTTAIKKPQAAQTRPMAMSARQKLTDKERQRIAAIAQQALGRPSLKVGTKQFRADCSGTVRAIFARARVGLGGILKNNSENDVKAIYRYVQKYGTILKNNPHPGDLVFFHNTYDRSRNGRMNDPLTHIGIVERIEGTTVHFIHHLGQSIIRSRMDLSLPQKTFNPTNNKKINDVLRKAQGQHRSYTAGELFAGYGRL